jgi:D-alanyl-lipoteichoic acid acyltransferase DltB (MBOAT superfamily)
MTNNELLSSWINAGVRMTSPLAVAITFLSITVTCVVFRSESVDKAISIWKGMLGFNVFAIYSVASGLCQTYTKTLLINGMEFVQGGVLL